MPIKIEPIKQTFWDISKLKELKTNPRKVRDEDLVRLEYQINMVGGLFKPLLIKGDGTVLGGNQRLKTLRKMNVKKVWVKLVKPENYRQELEYVLSDNGRQGTAVMSMVKELVELTDWDAQTRAMFKIDTDLPMTLEQILQKETQKILGGPEKDVDTTKEKLDKYLTGDQRQIVLFLTPEEKDRVEAQFIAFREEFGIENNSSALLNLLSMYENDHATTKKR